MAYQRRTPAPPKPAELLHAHEDLADLAAAWPRLPTHVKATLLDVARASLLLEPVLGDDVRRAEAAGLEQRQPVRLVR